MKIAMFGGSFNPVHNGHIELAKAVHEQAGYDKVLFVPAYHSPFKDLPSGASDEDRLCMLRLALEGFDWAFIEDCELKRGGISYTYETVEFLEQKYAASGELTGKLGLVIGTDLVAGFSRWHRAEELAAKVDIILARRNLDVFSGKPCDTAGELPHAATQTAPEKAEGAPQMMHETALQTSPKTPNEHGSDAPPHNVGDAQAGTSQKMPLLPFAYYELKNPYVDVSSSEIRDAVHAARSAQNAQSGASCGSQSSAQAAKTAQTVRDKKRQSSKIELMALVPESVCDYILERRLYE